MDREQVKTGILAPGGGFGDLRRPSSRSLGLADIRVKKGPGILIEDAEWPDGKIADARSERRSS